jgi:hypothetical protein
MSGRLSGLVLLCTLAAASSAASQQLYLSSPTYVVGGIKTAACSPGDVVLSAVWVGGGVSIYCSHPKLLRDDASFQELAAKLSAQLSVLQSNVRAWSVANDALTSRLDALTNGK